MHCRRWSWAFAVAAASVMTQLACGASDATEAAAAAAITAVSSTTLTGTAGQAMIARPSVKVMSSSGAPVAGVRVTFAVGSGGGSLTGGPVATDAAGVATVASWTLGTVAGPNTMTATVAGLEPVTFTATGLAGPPSALVKAGGDDQAAPRGNAVATPPSARVVDAHGNPLPGVSVAFAVASGGGSITDAARTTNASGVATVGSWTLGPAEGTNALMATSAGLASVTFTANGTSALTMAPAIAATAPGGSVVFTAQHHVAVPQTVTWRVNGVAGGTAESGLISAGGAYTAPATIPAGDSVVVTAVLATDPTEQRSSTVFFIPDLTTRDYYVAIPRVVDAAQSTRTRFLLVPPSSATSVTFVPTASAPEPLTPIGNGVLTFELDAATASAGYINGALHNFVGRLDYRGAGGEQIKLTNLSVNVRDGAMPSVVVTTLAEGAQRSPYVLNIRTDMATIYPSASIVSRALQLLGGDQFDFVAVIATVTTNSNRVHIGVRNDILGIGAGVFDNSAPWGGAGRLRGVLAFPIDGFFDGAEQGMLHEMGHSWINHATDAVLGPGRPHWPPSTMALGTMGFNIPGSNVGGNFPWALTPLGDGTVRIGRVAASDRFTPLDLYLMGVLPPDAVPAMYVLSGTANPGTYVDGMISAATTYTIADYIASHGVRVPSSTSAQREFATAVVVLTYGRLMTASEMAFFDHASARAETTVPLYAVSGLSAVNASGFFLATGGRATLRTRLP